MTQDNLKWCSKCQTWKTKTDFSKNRSRPDGLQNYCKPCAYQAHLDSVNQDKLNQTARRKRRAEKIQTLYGMSIEDYELLLFEQNDQCAICFSSLGVNPIPYKNADSDTSSALLCDACGAGLRFFDQSTDRLFRAISFLDSFNTP